MDISPLHIHLAALVLTLVCVVYADHLGLQYVRGKKEVLSARTLRTLHRLVGVGLVAMIVSGVLMARTYNWSYLMSESAFVVKMGFVLMLCINAFVIGRLSHVATRAPFASLTTPERLPLLISGAVSAIGWAGAVIVGLFFLEI